ncbi:MAG: DUF1697 domain-containing protein [Vicinamibacteria bacterium]
MRTLVALLRGVNVGGNCMLSMADLAALCTRLGFADVRTYIQSGNVVFRTELTADRARAALQHALATHMGRPIDVVVRDADALRRVLAENPFAQAEGAKVAVLFCAEPVPKGLVDGLSGPDGEVVIAAGREVYVHYVQGMGRSKLKLPKALGVLTVRNANTVAKLSAMADALAAILPRATSPGGRAGSASGSAAAARTVRRPR